MRWAVGGGIKGLFRRARDTVECETPAKRAMSLMDIAMFEEYVER
jgi:hypothetical protein